MGVLCWMWGVVVDLACMYVRSKVDISNTTVYEFCENTALNFNIVPNHSLVFKL
jgi:hypothetical protein